MANGSRKHLYIFLDEAGNFDFSDSGTKHLVFSAITSERPFSWEEGLSALKFDLIENGRRQDYFHATEDLQAVRNEVFRIIAGNISKFSIDSLIIEKRKTGPALQPIEFFYPRMLFYLLRYVYNSMRASACDEMIIITDNIPHKKKRKAIEKSIKETMTQKLNGRIPYKILHHASRSSFGLQVADYCNWAIYRKWEKGDDRSYEVINSAIHSEFDIFRTGRTYYY